MPSGTWPSPDRSRLPRFRIAAALVLGLGGPAAADVAASAPSPVTRDSASEDRPFSFVVWGHPRGAKPGDPPYHGEEIVDRIKELKADLLIMTGDMIWGAVYEPTVGPDDLRADWDRLDAAVATLGIPVHRVPGNHDIHNFMTRDVYLERYPKPPTAFTYANCRFILLDTVGIDQRSVNADAYWGSPGLPLDAGQLEFLRKEMQQQEGYRHVFIFMHHSSWHGQGSQHWWDDVHPILRGTKTRAVFNGNPRRLKYMHSERDGIHYIQSSQLRPPSPRKARYFMESWPLVAHPDTIQHVRVDGDRVRYDTIMVGAFDSRGLSPDYWEKVDRSPGPADLLAVTFHRKFRHPKQLLVGGAVAGGTCFLLGASVAALWMRRRARRLANASAARDAPEPIR